ncbi:sialate O-acetylesterase [Flavobacterium sp. Sd200]|uniref:sialate O-acetylesterase n=1 Tax=Flavobacterium sp. Sd200 TaxID=2692211 RepID=UPI001370EA92|nr:sialate O-acetylesterase [Flavobacterium sp. Sd200]MXN93192.1 sialate O-acetylesterase [Flavobacterium sp. Sd200]
MIRSIKKIYRLQWLALALLLGQATVFAQVKLPKLISNGMVLQHSQNLKLWGWAAPSEKVSLLFNGKSYTAKANATGEWIINLPSQKAGGPFTMTFSASNKVEVSNILFGDVWLCSGQSNMELAMNRLLDTYPEEANAKNDNIRQFLVPDVYNFKAKQPDVNSGNWASVSPTTIADFSGVAYFFAKAVYQKHHIPIGIINASLGGSPAQAWISEGSLKKFPEYFDQMQSMKDDKLIAKIEQEDKQASAAWYGELNKKDEGLKKGWKTAAFDDSGWNEMKVPGYWADTQIGNVNGAVWFRKTINVPQGMTGLEAKLQLGRIVDADSVYVNDVFVGTTSYQYPPRDYKIAAGVLKAGKNTIAVRIINNAGKGGFILDKPYKITAGKEIIDLQGLWKFKTGVVMQPLKSQTFIRWKSGGLFNAMIAPLQNYAIKGALWYQGESNTGKPTEYSDLMKTLIADWRAGWKQEFPFIYVQLPGYMEEKQEPTDTNWAVMREQQSKIITVPNTAMAVALDLGEWNDIHPVNKKDVGERLALQAEKLVYGNTKVVASGPSVKAIRKESNKIIVSFNDIGSGLMAKGDNTLHYFAIAGADEKYVWATAVIKNNEVVVYSDLITNPVFIKYAWADNPAKANLYNKEGLPAAPFKSKL